MKCCKSIDQLQYEYLSKLLSCNKRMTIKQAIHRMNVMSQYVAYYLAIKS